MSIQLAFRCVDCDAQAHATMENASDELKCPSCDRVISPRRAEGSAAKLDRCLVCGCGELFVRKDFSQRLGVTIVAIGFLLSSVAWGFHWIYTAYAVLFATALIDVCLYLTVGNLLQCYRCSATYRGLDDVAAHSGFELQTHEKFRQQVARLR